VQLPHADKIGRSRQQWGRGTREIGLAQSSIQLGWNSFYRRVFERAGRISPWDSDPVRQELFSVERLEEHGRSLALAQKVALKSTKGRPLAGRLAENGGVLLDAYLSIVRAINEGRAITPAAEWLIDNYHLVEKQIRQIRSDLPPGYYRQLPKIAAGPLSGFPRVFGMAWAFVAHTDSRFDSEMLVRYVRAYQEVQPLSIGELWAVSITLRIVLIENLRRLAQQIVNNREAREKADDLADRLLGAGGGNADPLSEALADQKNGRLSEAFAVQLVHRLRDQDPKVKE
jgi:cyclic beta-1,2-glucan synthetase